MAKWRGIVPMANPPEDRRYRIPTATSRGESADWMAICRLDGHLAYDATCDDQLPPTNREWHIYKKGVAPAPKVVSHYLAEYSDPELVGQPLSERDEILLSLRPFPKSPLE